MAAMSGYLKNRIDSMEAPDKPLLINDMSFEYAEILLEYMYTGQFTLHDQPHSKVRSAAELLQLDYLLDTLSVEDFGVKPESSGTESYSEAEPASPSCDVFPRIIEKTPVLHLAALEAMPSEPKHAEDDSDYPSVKEEQGDMTESRRRSKRVKATKRGRGRPKLQAQPISVANGSNKKQQTTSPWKKELLRSYVATVQCAHCSYAFHHRSALKLHLKLHHIWTNCWVQRYRNSVEQARRAQLWYCLKGRGAASKACDICKMYFRFHSLCQLHLTRKHAPTHRCHQCQKSFASWKLWNLHRKTHVTRAGQSSVDYCQYCSRGFTSKRRLKKHIATNVGCQKRVLKTKLLCRFCDQTLPTRRRFMSHLTRHKLSPEQCAVELGNILFPKDYFCEICLSCLPTLKSLTRHMQHDHSLVPKSRVGRPSKTTKAKQLVVANRPKLRSGRKSIDSKPKQDATDSAAAVVPVMQTIVDRKRIYSCHSCPFKTTTEIFLSRHVKSFHKDKKAFQCDLCHKGYNVTLQLRRHKYRKHGIPDETLRPIKCSMCDYETFYPSTMKAHEERHQPDLPTSCEQCGETFINKRSKEKHVLAVHARKTPSRRVEPKETCPRCKLSVRRSNMSEHMLRHERNDSVVFNCSQCDFTTHDKYALNVHLFKLHGDRSQIEHNLRQCEICGFEAIGSGKLKIHMRTHTGEKPFTCSWCGKRFHKKANLAGHIKWNHSDVRFDCSYCPYQTKSNEHLKQHIRIVHTHRSVKPYKCFYCDYRSHLSGNCNLHCKQKHQGLPVKWVKVCEKYPENHNEEIHVGPSPFGKRSTPK